MSNNEWYEDDDDFGIEEDLDADNGLRNLRKSERAKSKRIKELEGELDGLRKFQRESVVSSVLNGKGVNPKIAAFIPQDIATDADAIDAWLTEYGDVFGVVSNDAETKSQNIDMSAVQRINAVTNSAQSPDDINDVYSRLNNAQSAEDIINMINGF